ncbi:glutamate receptor ionotropic, delta-2-like [Palaemon carinicauda]|uniref:glutamate receptor ionotropic, delta-2-like n=1 Tax=Palaemon carinicauda TaxID=392227 RepID=UPI0035B5D87F
MWPTQCLVTLLIYFTKYVTSVKDVNTLDNLQNPRSRFGAKTDNDSVYFEYLVPFVASSKSVSRNKINDRTPLMLTSDLQENSYCFFLDYSEERSSMVGNTLWKIIDIKKSGCYFMFATMDSSQPWVYKILWRSFTTAAPMILVDFSSKNYILTEGFLERAWKSGTNTCHTLIVDLTADSNFHILRALNMQKLWQWPNANVLMVGTDERARPATQHPALRNTIQPLYLGIDEKPDKNCHSMEEKFIKQKFLRVNLEASNNDNTSSGKEHMRLYTRCLYCNQGKSRTKLLLSWLMSSTHPELMLPDQKENFQGHLMKVISLNLQPYSVYIQSKDGPGGVVTMVDSFDKRLLDALASQMNFTYEVRSPKDMLQGSRLPNGSWNGVIGAVYNNEADFTTIIGASPERAAVLDHQITLYIDQVMITSLKPQFLPQYLVFFRPFSENVWIILLFTIIIWASSLWILQEIRFSFDGQKGDSFSKIIFNSWAILLGNPSNQQSSNFIIQMMLGWWLVVSFLVSSFFKSSLVAHLTVEGKTRPIDTCSDLVQLSNWKWGIDIRVLVGLTPAFFRENVDPDVRYVYEHHEKLDTEEGLKRVLRGRFSFVSAKFLVLQIIGSKYTNRYYETPFYLGKKQYLVAPALGWGFRKGAPFKERFFKAIIHLWESGISDRWKNEIQDLTIKRKKEENAKENQSDVKSEANVLSGESDRRVLRTQHMLGVYLILIVGLTIALLTFVAEKLFQNLNFKDAYIFISSAVGNSLSKRSATDHLFWSCPNWQESIFLGNVLLTDFRCSPPGWQLHAPHAAASALLWLEEWLCMASASSTPSSVVDLLFAITMGFSNFSRII